MSQPIISVKNLSKKYILGERQPYYSFRDTISGILSKPFRKQKLQKDEFWALKDVSFDVHQGDVVGIIGRNGAGKSTLLKILSQITPPTEGRVELRGRVASLLEVGTGFHPELTGRENIYLNGAILGMTRKEIDEKFNEIVEFAEISKFLDTPVKHYSSGMYMRLAFSVAAHLEPEILIIDEVLAVGDVQFQKKCLGKMDEVSKKDGRTVIFVSHNMAAIQNLCSKTIVLDEGRVAFSLSDTRKAVNYYLNHNGAKSMSKLADIKNRTGAGNIVITGFHILDANNKEVETASSGQYIKFKIDYKCKVKKVNNISIAMTITRDDGFLISLLSNEYTSDLFDRISGTGSFYCTLRKNPLMSGRYLVNLNINQNGVNEDWILEAVSFETVDGDYFGTGKVIPASHRCVLLDQEWSVKINDEIYAK